MPTELLIIISENSELTCWNPEFTELSLEISWSVLKLENILRFLWLTDAFNTFNKHSDICASTNNIYALAGLSMVSSSANHYNDYGKGTMLPVIVQFGQQIFFNANINKKLVKNRKQGWRVVMRCCSQPITDKKCL